jgi:hypothetical protein
MTAGATFRAISAAAVLAAAFALPQGGKMSEQPYQPDERLSTPLFGAVAIAHDAQRYDTVGDWNFIAPSQATHIRVSKLPDRRFEILVAVHELVEAEACRQAGITPEEVTAYDEKYERDRADQIKALQLRLGQAVAARMPRAVVGGIKSELRHVETAEPGDDPAAPYHLQHQFATKIERQVARQLGVDWKAYEAAINSLEWRKAA